MSDEAGRKGIEAICDELERFDREMTAAPWAKAQHGQETLSPDTWWAVHRAVDGPRGVELMPHQVCRIMSNARGDADAHGIGFLRNNAARIAAELRRAHAALEKINEIRNSIVGRQAINWSGHIYPLVAALNEAGYVGDGYDIGRQKAIAEIAAVFEETDRQRARADAAETEVRQLRRLCESLLGEVDEAHAALRGEP